MLPIEPGVKIAAQMSPEPDEDDLRFVRQMGIEFARANAAHAPSRLPA